jgi:sulfur carrier protein
MKLTINGELKEDIKAETISALLDELGIVRGRVAVEGNLSVISRTEHETFGLKDGDVVEIVNFVGGG